jgi:hypothetical protein
VWAKRRDVNPWPRSGIAGWLHVFADRTIRLQGSRLDLSAEPAMKHFLNHIFSAAVALACALVAFPAGAEFHTFAIEEIFSNTDGTIQYVVLHESLGFNGENFLAGHAFTATNGMTTNTYIFNRDLPGGEMGGGYGMPMPSPPRTRAC